MQGKYRNKTRDLVRERDMYTCQNCKSIRTPEEAKRLGKKLFDVHHLEGLCGKLSKKRDPISMMPKLITLCHKCHFNHPEHTTKREGYIKKRDPLSVRKEARVVRLREKNYSYRQIAKRMGLSFQRIHQIASKAGW